MNINISIQKRHLYLFSLLILAFGTIIFVQGQGVSNFGHTDEQVDFIPTGGAVEPLGDYIRSELCQKDGTNCANPSLEVIDGFCQANANSAKTCTIADGSYDFCTMTGGQGIGPGEKGYIFTESDGTWKFKVERDNWAGKFYWYCFKFA